MGLKWDLTDPVCDFYPHQMHSKQDSDIIQAKICKLNKGVIIPTEREDEDFVSNISTRKKRDDIYWMI